MNNRLIFTDYPYIHKKALSTAETVKRALPMLIYRNNEVIKMSAILRIIAITYS